MNDWEFVSFVNGTIEVEDSRKQIALLVKNRKNRITKLVIMHIDPWINIVREKEFYLPENFFVADGVVIRPPGEEEDLLGVFTDDKIRSVEFLSIPKNNFVLVF